MWSRRRRKEPPPKIHFQFEEEIVNQEELEEEEKTEKRKRGGGGREKDDHNSRGKKKSKRPEKKIDDLFVEAARLGEVEKLTEMLEKEDIDLNYTEVLGSTAPHYAVFYDHPEVVDLLIQSGAKLNIQNHSETKILGSGATPLHWAVEQKKYQIAEKLLTALATSGVSTDLSNKEGQTPLHCAASMGDLEMVKLLVEVGKANVNAFKGEERISVLMEASSVGALDVVKYLVSAGANVNSKSEKSVTALIKASIKGHAAVVYELLDASASPNEEDSTGKTALHWAAFFGKDEVITLLLLRGADTTKKDKTNSTALDLAISRGFKSTAKLLKKE